MELTFYDLLNPVMQEMIDVYIRRLTPLTWKSRIDVLVEALPAFGLELTPDQARKAARAFFTALVERLGEEAVDDPFQASLYLVSLNLDHQAAASEYLHAHPGFKVQELLGPGSDAAN
jgi:hypothetical protein